MSVVNSNPALSRGFKDVPTVHSSDAETMTLGGAVDKTILSLIVLVAAGALGFKAGVGPLTLIGLFVAFIIAIVTTFKPSIAPKTTLPYALIEGFVLGGISRIYESEFNGIVLQAAGLTVAIFATLLFVYKARLISVSRNFVLGVTAATGGIAVFYLVSILGSVVGFDVPLIHSNSGWGILFSFAVVALASANLVVDFDFIEKAAASNAPKYMEWYGAFGLMVTVVWLYLELLRLLSKLRSR